MCQIISHFFSLVRLHCFGALGAIFNVFAGLTNVQVNI